MSYDPNPLNWNKCEWTKIRDKVSMLMYQGQNITTTLAELVPGHTTNPHKHEYEQLVIILQGECDFYVGETAYPMTAGCLLSIPPNVEHYVVAHGETPLLNLDIFWPKRPDRKQSVETDCREEQAHIKLFTSGTQEV